MYALLTFSAKYDQTISADLKESYSQLAKKAISIYGTAESNNNSRDTSEGTVFPAIRMTLAPYIQGWTFTNVTVEPITEVSFAPVSYLPVSTGSSNDQQLSLNRTVLQYRITYQRSAFTKVFAVALVVIMWVLSAYQFVLAVDHVIVRRRDLQPDTVGAAVGLVFALPALRLLMDAPFGRYVVGDIACHEEDICQNALLINST
jgi:hypothetical protein